MGTQYLLRQHPTGEWKKPTTGQSIRASTGVATSRVATTRTDVLDTARSGVSQDPLEVWMSQRGDSDGRAVNNQEIDELSQAIDSKQDLPLNYYLRGECYRRLGYLSQAIEDLNCYLDLDPFDHNPYYSRALCFVEARKFAPALIDFENTFSVQEPVSVDTLTNVARCALELGQLEKAKKFILNAIALSPSATNHYWCALIFEALGDEAAKTEHFQICREMDDNLPNEFIEEAISLAEKENYEGEILNYSRLLSMFPNWFEIMERRGVAYMNLFYQIMAEHDGGARETTEGASEALSNALNDFTVCINLDTDRSTHALLHRARLLRNHVKAYARAASDLTLYLETYSDHHDSVEALVLQGDCLVKCGGTVMRKRAKEAYNELIDREVSVFEVSRFHEEAFYFFAVRHARDGEWASSIEHFLNATKKTGYTRDEMEEITWLPFYLRAMATDEGLHVDGRLVDSQSEIQAPLLLSTNCVTEVARGNPETKESVFPGARGVTERDMADWLTRVGDSSDCERCVKLYKSAHEKKVDLRSSGGCYALQTWLYEEQKANEASGVDPAAAKKKAAGPIMRSLSALAAKAVATLDQAEVFAAASPPDPLNQSALTRLQAMV